MTECPICSEILAPDLFQPEMVCDKCGCLMNLTYTEVDEGFIIDATVIIP